MKSTKYKVIFDLKDENDRKVIKHMLKQKIETKWDEWLAIYKSVNDLEYKFLQTKI